MIFIFKYLPMKKAILFFSFYCFVSVLHAQEFWVERFGIYGENGDDYVDIKDKKFQDELENLIRLVTRINRPQKVPEYKNNREKWVNRVKDTLLTKEIKNILRDTSFLKGKSFVVSVRFNKEGNVFTVGFLISHSIYEKLSQDWLKSTFNYLMKEKVRVADFWDFSQVEQDALGSIEFSVIDLIKERGGNPDGERKTIKPEE